MDEDRIGFDHDPRKAHGEQVAIFPMRYGPPADESRLGLNKYYPTYPLGIFPCREGWLGVTVGHLDQWAAFCDMLDIKPNQTGRFATNFLEAVPPT